MTYWLRKLPKSLSNVFKSKETQTIDLNHDNMEDYPLSPKVTTTITDTKDTEEKDVRDPLQSTKSKLSKSKLSHLSYNPLSNSDMSVIAGPKHNRHRYYIALGIMFISGSSSDFLAKLVYQFIPTDVSKLVFYWMSWLVTLCAFLICTFAIINGRESFKLLNWNYFLRICIPAWCDVFVSGGRYVALVFLPASIVSVLKNGLQLVFLAMIRAMLSQYITRWQVAGIAILWVGLVLCMIEDILQIDDLNTLWGLILMFFVGLFGAIRNSIEEFLLKKEGFHPDFILGLEGIISFTTMLIIGVIFFFATIDTGSMPQIPQQVAAFFSVYYPALICIFIFMIVLVTKKSTQFHVTKMSSAMTRKLFQQFYPIGVWIMVLFSYYVISPQFGESWDQWQWLRIIGIVFVILGTFVYLKPEYFQPIFYCCNRGKK